MSDIKVQIDKLGIMCVEYPLHATVGINEIKQEYKKRIKITDKKTPLLVKIHGMSFFTDEAQEFLCSPKNVAITSAAAIVRDTNAGYFEHSNVLMNVFKMIKKPSFDVNVFDTDAAAYEWLKQYL